MTERHDLLLGTEWLKVSAKHHGQKARIDSVSSSGPRMRFLGQPVRNRHASNQQFMHLKWIELGGNWKPLDQEAETKFAAWMLAGAEKLYNTIESDKRIVTEPIVQMEACTSVYHRPAKGLVPVSQGSLTRNNNFVCFECRDKRNNYNKTRTEKVKRIMELGERQEISSTYAVPPKLEILPVETLPEWRVTVVEPTIHIVRARDFLDAAAQVSEKGEVVKVEKI